MALAKPPSAKMVPHAAHASLDQYTPPRAASRKMDNGRMTTSYTAGYDSINSADLSILLRKRCDSVGAPTGGRYDRRLFMDFSQKDSSRDLSSSLRSTAMRNRIVTKIVR